MYVMESLAMMHNAVYFLRRLDSVMSLDYFIAFTYIGTKAPVHWDNCFGWRNSKVTVRYQ